MSVILSKYDLDFKKFNLEHFASYNLKSLFISAL